MAKPWTPEEVEKLTLLYNAGLSLREIGMQLGRTESVVKSKIANTPSIKSRQVKAKTKAKRKFTEEAKISLGYYERCTI